MSPLRQPPRTSAPTNLLLSALPRESYQKLQTHLRQVALSFGEILYTPGDAVHHLYFPTDSIISLVANVRQRMALELGIIGKEGVSGIEVLLGVKNVRTQMIVQAEGAALRIDAATFMDFCETDEPTQQLMLRYVYALMGQISQSAVCNRFHSATQRLARWLLMTQDRIERDHFRMTQEFLALMLGVRREGVNVAARALSKRELIRYSRGRVAILDRRKLIEASCDCYAVVNREHESVYHQKPH